MRKYTVFDISEKLNVDPETVRRWIRSGEMKSTITSKKKGHIITEEDFIEFCKNSPKLNTRVEEHLDEEIAEILKSDVHTAEEYIKICKKA